jgi:hypothetical protein
MPKEKKTANELVRMITDEIGRPDVTISVHREGQGWRPYVFQRGAADVEVEMRIQQIGERLTAIYDLKE